MIDTKHGLILEPTAPEARSLYTWLKKYQPSLDGSPAYEEMVEVYETLEFDLNEEAQK